MENLYYEDDDMHPIDIQVRDPRTGTVVQITVIGVMDVITDSFSRTGMGMFALKDNLEQVLPFPMPITTYRFRMAEGVNIAAVADNLDKAFQRNGMEAKVLKELVEEQNAAERAFNKLFIAYMGMDLMVGIAALGVISLRAVVERRQQIGVLRAIGYRRRMVQWSFLLESSFLALLGVAVGVGLGIILSYNIVRDIQADIETIRFRIPWIQIMVIVMVVYFFSLLTTYLPARQASRIYPAEALPYE
jgi:putative ABC transport system permease protein